jgi:hypothetical protein
MPATIMSPQAVVNGLGRRREAPTITQRASLNALRVSLFFAFELPIAQIRSQSPRAKEGFRRPPLDEIGGGCV